MYVCMYICIITAVTFLVWDAVKLTLEQLLTITIPHLIEGVLINPPYGWVTNAQALLLNPSILLNPAALLPNPDSYIIHDYTETLQKYMGSHQT